MTKEVKVLVIRSDDRTPIPGAHRVEKESQLPQTALHLTQQTHFSYFPPPFKKFQGWAWWCMPVIPALRRQKQDGEKLQDSLSCAEY